MQPREKINKSSWTLMETVKDSVSTNLTIAVRSGQLKVEAAQVPTLLALIAASVDEGYHRAHGAFMKTVDVGLREAASAAEEALLNEQDIAKKK